jgi:CRP-like cAMP-binding protein
MTEEAEQATRRRTVHATDTARAILKQNFLFRDLPETLIGRIAALAIRRKFSRNSMIFSQGDVGDSLYGVVSGRVRISAEGPEGREMFLNIMEPGDTFGEIAVIDGLPRTASAVVLDASTLIVVRRDDFLDILEGEPTLAMHLLTLICQRLRWASDLVEESVFLVGPARLARRLLVLAALHGKPAAGGMELALSQAELASFLGISRQFVNQNLRSWQERGWVALARSRILITDAEALRRVAESIE